MGLRYLPEDAPDVTLVQRLGGVGGSASPRRPVGSGETQYVTVEPRSVHEQGSGGVSGAVLADTPSAHVGGVAEVVAVTVTHHPTQLVSSDVAVNARACARHRMLLEYKYTLCEWPF